MKTKIIKTQSDKQQYRDMCKYCFTDRNGWTDSMLTDPGEEQTIYGIFEGKSLKGGIISKHYTVHLFGSLQQMSGISAVASYPETRNKGYIRQIMGTLLKDEKKDGKTLSCLYPFSFAYYARFGYGSIGEYRHVSFTPSDIIPIKDAQPLVPFDGSRTLHDELVRMKADYLSSFDFGSVPDEGSAKDLGKELANSRSKLYLSFRNGKVLAHVRYSLTPAGTYSSDIAVSEIAWTAPEGLKDIMAHLAAHRGQCDHIRADIQQSVPFHLFTSEPRITTGVVRSWMARPLDLRTLLETKLADGNFGQLAPVMFSVKDPVCEEETATYLVKDGCVEKKDFDGTNLIAMPVLSSLLFGGMSAEQACDSGLCGEWAGQAKDFFGKKRENFLNERF